MSRGFVWRTLRAPTTRHGNFSVTPVARVVGLRWPFGGWLWLFPVAVEVQRHHIRPWVHDEKPARLPIIDVTRLLLVLFLAGTLAALWLTRRQSSRRRQQHAVRN